MKFNALKLAERIPKLVECLLGIIKASFNWARVCVSPWGIGCFQGLILMMHVQCSLPITCTCTFRCFLMVVELTMKVLAQLRGVVYYMSDRI